MIYPDADYDIMVKRSLANTYRLPYILLETRSDGAKRYILVPNDMAEKVMHIDIMRDRRSRSRIIRDLWDQLSETRQAKNVKPTDDIYPAYYNSDVLKGAR